MTGMSMMWPTVQGLMSKEVSASQQGLLQGSIQGLRGLTGIAGPGLFTWIFAKAITGNHTTWVDGTPFFLAAALVLLEFAIALRVARPALREAD